MGTADDLEEFRACQAGYAGDRALNDMSRGAAVEAGPRRERRKMGMNPR
jgi:benzoate/toluate 1,2-dioxygenase alpha subunit